MFLCRNLPPQLGLMTSLRSMPLDGNPLRLIRRELVNGEGEGRGNISVALRSFYTRVTAGGMKTATLFQFNLSCMPLQAPYYTPDSWHQQPTTSDAELPAPPSRPPPGPVSVLLKFLETRMPDVTNPRWAPRVDLHCLEPHSAPLP